MAANCIGAVFDANKWNNILLDAFCKDEDEVGNEVVVGAAAKHIDDVEATADAAEDDPVLKLMCRATTIFYKLRADAFTNNALWSAVNEMDLILERLFEAAQHTPLMEYAIQECDQSIKTDPKPRTDTTVSQDLASIARRVKRCNAKQLIGDDATATIMRHIIHTQRITNRAVAAH